MAQIVQTDKSQTPQLTKKQSKRHQRQERMAVTVVKEAQAKKQEIDAFLGQFEHAQLWQGVAKMHAPRYVRQ